eukprot:TRINITY_DN18075_c0_g2_i1.p1 TRINITY_DN18075_c0_g2~~TRINITY_DN18075_c0_g2_i1.p1  ORF type:complete len:151 (-),score=1.84 TRINITY_DN18075_c0_g2_i1:80-481(-)
MSVAAFAPPTVGFLAERCFGYVPPAAADPPGTAGAASATAGGESMGGAGGAGGGVGAAGGGWNAADARNAEALSLGLVWTMALPFAVCCAVYGWLYWTYPKDRDQARAEAAAEASGCGEPGSRLSMEEIRGEG